MPHNPAHERDTAAREALQDLAKEIAKELGDPTPFVQDTDIDRSWKVISAYIQICLEIESPERPNGPPDRPDLKTVANAEAHFRSFVWKVTSHDHWKYAFPTVRFLQAWGFAGNELHDELTSGGEVSGHQFTVCREILYQEALQEESAMPDNPNRIWATLITCEDATRSYYSCDTGWSDTLPDDLQHLQLNKSALGDPTAIAQMRSEAQHGLCLMKKYHERTLSSFPERRPGTSQTRLFF